MSTEPFLTPRLVGERFEGHAIPLEVLKDFAVLEQMIVEVAKWKFLQEHQGRSRSLRGFTDGIELKLTGVEDGSAKLIINLVVASGMLFDSAPPYFEKARDATVQAISAAEQQEPVTEILPDSALGYFDRFGRSLRADEAMEFTTPARPAPAKLTRESRRRLVLASDQVKEYTEECLVRGLIPEADQDRMTFEIQTIEGYKATAPIVPQHIEAILEGFNGFKGGVRVSLQGIGKYSRQGKLQSIESVEHISILDDLDVPARLDELGTLQDGWFEGGGVAPTKTGLDWFSMMFEGNFPNDLPLPYLYPTPDGNIQAEWSIAPNEITLEIDLKSKSGEWHCLNTDTSNVTTLTLGLIDEKGWTSLVDTLRQIAGDSE